jgi:lipoprotein-anchoring transpeptidase ErfK/SrfK
MNRAGAATGLTLLAAAVSLTAASTTVRSSRAPGTALPPPVAPAFTPGTPRRLGSTRDVSHWAPVKQATIARAGPDGAAPAVTALPRRTPEGTRNAVLLIGRRGGWVHVRLPVLPNGRTGWVRRTALGGYEAVRTRLDVDLERLRATLYRDGRRVLTAAVGVGSVASPTPRGHFYIRNELTRYRSPAYGPVAFGTSARSPTATDWPAGGYIGIHGTDRPELLPGRVSHGCIRMRNADILALAARMPVGTPVLIH